MSSPRPASFYPISQSPTPDDVDVDADVDVDVDVDVADTSTWIAGEEDTRHERDHEAAQPDDDTTAGHSQTQTRTQTRTQTQTQQEENSEQTHDTAHHQQQQQEQQHQQQEQPTQSDTTSAIADAHVAHTRITPAPRVPSIAPPPTHVAHATRTAARTSQTRMKPTPVVTHAIRVQPSHVIDDADDLHDTAITSTATSTAPSHPRTSSCTRIRVGTRWVNPYVLLCIFVAGTYVHVHVHMSMCRVHVQCAIYVHVHMMR